MSRDDRRTEARTERDHQQTRKGESDARGSSQWHDDVVSRGEDEESDASVSAKHGKSDGGRASDATPDSI